MRRGQEARWHVSRRGDQRNRKARDTAPLWVDGADIRPAIAQTLGRMKAFARGVRDGSVVGRSGRRFTDVINIRIGGSDLGPMMATRALAPYHDGPRCHFLSNVDGAHAHDMLGVLGQIIALYKHLVFVEGAIWGINSFAYGSRRTSRWQGCLNARSACKVKQVAGETDVSQPHCGRQAACAKPGPRPCFLSGIDHILPPSLPA
jgi:hypothetical protein